MRILQCPLTTTFRRSIDLRESCHSPETWQQEGKHSLIHSFWHFIHYFAFFGPFIHSLYSDQYVDAAGTVLKAAVLFMCSLKKYLTLPDWIVSVHYFLTVLDDKTFNLKNKKLVFLDLWKLEKTKFENILLWNLKVKQKLKICFLKQL